MKLTFLFIVSSLVLLSSSCKKEDCSGPSCIVGEWELVEQLIDPGNGSGTFQPVSSDKEIKFFDDGTFEANGDMCGVSTESGSSSEGTYDTLTNTFSPSNCLTMPPTSYNYSVTGNTLILTYFCIESCKQKYKRI